MTQDWRRKWPDYNSPYTKSTQDWRRKWPGYNSPYTEMTQDWRRKWPGYNNPKIDSRLLSLEEKNRVKTTLKKWRKSYLIKTSKKTLYRWSST